MYHCPLCGGDLRLLPAPEQPEVDWGADQETIDRQLMYQEMYRPQKREEYECLGKGCFREDFPLYCHHPMGGIDSAPGDSWSLSWVQ